MNGSWTGVVGDVADGKSHVAFVSIINNNQQYSQYADVTVPYTGDGYRWHVPCAKPVPGRLSLTRVFHPSAWLTLILALLLVSLLVRSLVKTSASRYFSAYSSITLSLLNLWAVILGVSAPNAVPRW